MATKGKDKIIEGQIAFDFMAEMEPINQTKAKQTKDEKLEQKVSEKVQVKTFSKGTLNIKPNHLKKTRKVKRISRIIKWRFKIC